MRRSGSLSPFFFWLIRLRISLLSYVESWLNEAQPNSGPRPSGPPGPPAPSPLSIPIPSDLLSSLHPGLEAWDRLHLFARCRRNTAPIWEKCVPDEVWGRRTKKSRRLLRWKWIQIQFQCDSLAGRRPGEWRKRRGERSKTRTADCSTSHFRLPWLARSETMLLLFCVPIGWISDRMFLLASGAASSLFMSQTAINDYFLFINVIYHNIFPSKCD